MSSHLPSRLALLTAVLLSIMLLFPVTYAAASDATDLLALVNQHRAANGLGPVCSDPLLNQAAAAHSQDMLNNNYFDHTGQNGSMPWDRIQATGYQGSYFSENIAFGYASAAEVFDGWRTSPGHNANMLSPSATEMGIGRVGDYWTQVFSNGEACSPVLTSGGKDPVVTPQPVPVGVAQPPPAAPQQPELQPAPEQPHDQPTIEDEVVWISDEPQTETDWSWDYTEAGYTCTTETWVDEYGVTWECTTCVSN